MTLNKGMTPEAIRSTQRIGLAVLESIADAGDFGAPSGILYAGLMSQGCSLTQYQSLMSPMEHRGFVQQLGDCYHITPSGIEFARKLRKILGMAPKDNVTA